MDRNGQLGLIALLAKELAPTHKLGRKAFQKIVHLATDFVGIPTGYQFSFYTYGAYSRELSSDLELAEDLGAVQSIRDGVGFDIQPGPACDPVIEFSLSELNNFEEQIKWLIEKFKDQSARTLELYSTIVFVGRNEPQLEDDEISARVLELKPKYDAHEVEAARNRINHFSEEVQRRFSGN